MMCRGEFLFAESREGGMGEDNEYIIIWAKQVSYV